VKVLQILPALESGGVERGTLEVANALVAAGHESLVVSAGGRLVTQLTATGSRHVTLNVGAKNISALRSINPLAELLKAERPDIVHVRSRLPAWIIRLTLAKFEGRKPVIVSTVHGFYSVSRYSAIMLRAEKIIAVSESIRNYITTNYPDTPINSITVIPRGVDPNTFPFGFRPERHWEEEWYREYPQLQDQFVITLPGRITRLKGHHDLIKLIAALKAENLSVHGVILGDEDPRRRNYAIELKNAVESAGLTDSITFVGYHSDVKNIYAVSNLILSLSTKPESFGRTVLESLRLGVPVFGYEHGGVAEVLNKLYPEGCIKVADHLELVQKTKRLIEGQIVTPAAQPQEFGIDEMLQSTLALYEQLTTTRPV